MMSRTVRYFKLMYIVAGILVSNEAICNTVDQIQITPRVEVRDLQQLQRKQRAAMLQLGPNGGATDKVNSALSLGMDMSSGIGMAAAAAAYARLSRPRSSWLQKLDINRALHRIKRRLTPLLGAFSIWTIPNYLLDYSTNFISRRFIISSDCDMIYSR